MIPRNWRQTLLKEWRQTLLSLAAEGCKQFKIKETTLGNKIVNDADFFPSLRAGGGCGVDKYIRVIQWFAKNLRKKHKSPKVNSR